MFSTFLREFTTQSNTACGGHGSEPREARPGLLSGPLLGRSCRHRGHGAAGPRGWCRDSWESRSPASGGADAGERAGDGRASPAPAPGPGALLIWRWHCHVAPAASLPAPPRPEAPELPPPPRPTLCHSGCSRAQGLGSLPLDPEPWPPPSFMALPVAMGHHAKEPVSLLLPLTPCRRPPSLHCRDPGHQVLPAQGGAAQPHCRDAGRRTESPSPPREIPESLAWALSAPPVPTPRRKLQRDRAGHTRTRVHTAAHPHSHGTCM